MEKLKVSLNNCLIPYSNYIITNYYTTDKFIYIILDKIPDCNLICKFVNLISNDSIEITIETTILQKKYAELNIAYCTIPIVSLYKPGFINNWELTIYSVTSNDIISQFQFNIKITTNNKSGKPSFSKEAFCGIFFERKV